jgi:hypothetical protein
LVIIGRAASRLGENTCVYRIQGTGFLMCPFNFFVIIGRAALRLGENTCVYHVPGTEFLMSVSCAFVVLFGVALQGRKQNPRLAGRGLKSSDSVAG